MDYPLVQPGDWFLCLLSLNYRENELNSSLVSSFLVRPPSGHQSQAGSINGNKTLTVWSLHLKTHSEQSFQKKSKTLTFKAAPKQRAILIRERSEEECAAWEPQSTAVFLGRGTHLPVPSACSRWIQHGVSERQSWSSPVSLWPMREPPHAF